MAKWELHNGSGDSNALVPHKPIRMRSFNLLNRVRSLLLFQFYTDSEFHSHSRRELLLLPLPSLSIDGHRVAGARVEKMEEGRWLPLPSLSIDGHRVTMAMVSWMVRKG
ncbi:hypothetical protein OIU85_027325 [Salix viminalis]|uniref:Uncharacterized protein n=1 Tax=Salix viminalis TaxID=40686 RepID=A0A9Q0QHU2_SALVM|nr:hypothetical protein OIU85_027325 [Salix viminalis]